MKSGMNRNKKDKEKRSGILPLFIIVSLIFSTVSGSMAVNIPLFIRSPSSAEVLICGYLFYRGAPESVTISNLNASTSWEASIFEQSPKPDFYYLYLSRSELSAGDTLHFNSTSGNESFVFNHTVREDEIDSGILRFDITEDLTVTELEISDRFAKDVNATIRSVIENIGLIPVVVPFNITFSVDGELVTTTSFTQLPLNASENFTVEFNWTPMESGIHNITITADPNHEIISETNESNNRMEKSVSAAKLPSFYVPLDFPTIQEAVDNVTINGTAIYVSNGTYNENITIQKQIILVGVDMNDTIIDGGGTGTIRLLADNCVIRGFSIINGSTGIKIESNGNKIFENWIYNNSCGINITGLKNIVYHNNLNNIQNGFDADNNSWDDGREGNYWSDCEGDDFNLDGIVDEPYDKDGVRDRYPLSSPFKPMSINPVITHITVPTSIYVNEANALFVGIANYGTSEVVGNLSLKLDNTTLNKTILMPYKSKDIVYFAYVPNQLGVVNLTAEIKNENEVYKLNVTNNQMAINFTVTESLFERLYNITDSEEHENYRLPENRKNALGYLERHQNSNGGIGIGGSSTDLAVLAVSSAGIDPHEFANTGTDTDQSLIDYMRVHPLQNDLVSISQRTLAILASGEDPSDFGGKNYLVMIQSFFDGKQFGVEGDVGDDCWAVLALSGVGYDKGMIQAGRDDIMRQQNMSDGGWGSMEATALAIDALIASSVSKDNSSILKGISYLRENLVKDQWDPLASGGEPDPLPESHLISYAYSVQAIVAAEKNPIDGSWNYSRNQDYVPNPYNPLLLLLGLEWWDPDQNSSYHDFNGGFKYSFRGYYPKPKWASFAVPAIYAKPYPLMKEYSNEILPDITPVRFDVPTCYANVTTSISTKVKNNGGMFNVTFLVNGTEMDNKRIKEFNSSAGTPVEFRWRPEKEGVYNLTIIADSDDEIVELNESDNCISRWVNVELPDLSIEAELPIFYVNVTNRIDASVSGFGENFNNSLFINGRLVDKIENITSYGTNETTFLWRPNQTGNYTHTLITDSEDDVVESNEENNIIEQNVTVIRPDIYPVNISYPDYLYTYTDNVINVNINGSAEGFSATLWVNESFVGRITNIISHTSTNITFTWNPEETGLYNLTVIIDSDADINETNESNNNLSCIVTVENREAPYIELLSPRGGECWAGVHTIGWNATDPNGEELAINISYSPDAGNLWCQIAYNLPNTGSYLWNTESVPDGYDYKVKVDVFDGNLTTSAQSKDVFTIYNKKSHEESPGFHYNAGFSLSDAPNTNETLWINESVNADIASSLVAGEDKIFVYCRDGFVRALDELTGNITWTSKPIENPTSGSWATAAYHDGSVFVASGHKVYRIDADDGSIIWSFTFPDGGCSVNGGPCIAYDRVYVGSWDGGHYYCLDEETDDVLWNFVLYDDRYGFQEPVYHHAQSTPAAYSGKVFFGDYNSEDNCASSQVYAVDAYTGKEIWNQTVEYSACGSLTVAHGRVYLTTFHFGTAADGLIYALNMKNGEIAWNPSIAPSDSTPAHAYGNIYVCGGEPEVYGSTKMYCLSDARNGEEVWSVPDLGVWTYSPVVADEKVFVGTANFSDGIYALNAFTKEEIWHSSLGGGSPAILQGRLYTVDEDGKVVCFGSKDKIDLAPINLEVPEPIYAKQNYTVDTTIWNLGPDDASAFNVSLRVNGEVVDEKRIGGLAGNSSTVVGFEWKPEKAERNCTLVVEVDCRNEIVETNPLNNKLNMTVDVLEGKDIAVLDVGCAAEVLIGDISVKPSIDAFYLEGEEVEVELRIDGAPLETKKEGVSGERLSVNFIWSPSKPGTYNLTVFADSNKTVTEVNENNNKLTKNVTVVALQPTPTSTPKTPGFGPGSRGGYGGGDEGGIGEGSGIGEAGAGEAGGMQIPANTSGSTAETKKKVLGFPFGNASSGASGGGGTLPLLFIALIVLTVALFYFGYYKEKRAYRGDKK